MARPVETSNLLRKLKSLKKKYKDSSVQVGYTQSYAIYVHENTNNRHAPGKQAKFLEGPLRQLRPEIMRVLNDTTARTGDVRKGLLAAGRFLQRESQKIVPIDTGALRASAFTKLD